MVNQVDDKKERNPTQSHERKSVSDRVELRKEEEVSPELNKLSGKKRKRSDTLDDPLINHMFGITRIQVPSLLKFMTDFMNQKKPIIITGLMDNWPAIRKDGQGWRNFDYLKRIAGMRTVPIEVGANYVAQEWKQTLMPLSKFIDDYILKESDEIGYLAQTQLFEQIPDLKKDIIVPDYCSLGDSDRVIIHSWFGPKGTVTPAHYDKYHNLLTQVLGRKYIRIYDTEQTPFLYPHEDKLLFNTSQVDIENPLVDKFPLFPKANYVECILQSGEMLYIPPNYWHYVRSLDISFSVSFWWE